MVKKVMYGVVALFTLYFGNWFYNYAFDKNVPTVGFVGIEGQTYYAGDAQCAIKSSHPFKVSNISVWLDDSVLIDRYSVSRSNFEHSFVIPTKTLANGKHMLKVEATSGTYCGAKAQEQCEFYVDNLPLQAA